MNDILVPADPADLIDRIIALDLRLAITHAPAKRSDLMNQRALLERLAARIMPTDAQMHDLTGQLTAARSDIVALTRDLQASDARKDYGIAFVALTQALLAAMTAVEDARAAINSHFARSNRQSAGVIHPI